MAMDLQKHVFTSSTFISTFSWERVYLNPWKFNLHKVLNTLLKRESYDLEVTHFEILVVRAPTWKKQMQRSNILKI